MRWMSDITLIPQMPFNILKVLERERDREIGRERERERERERDR